MILLAPVQEVHKNIRCYLILTLKTTHKDMSRFRYAILCRSAKSQKLQHILPKY